MKTFTVIAMLVASTAAIRVRDDDLVLPAEADTNDIEADKQIFIPTIDNRTISY